MLAALAALAAESAMALEHDSRDSFGRTSNYLRLIHHAKSRRQHRRHRYRTLRMHCRERDGKIYGLNLKFALSDQRDSHITDSHVDVAVSPALFIYRPFCTALFVVDVIE